jgi:hypothetical protein
MLYGVSCCLSLLNKALINQTAFGVNFYGLRKENKKVQVPRNRLEAQSEVEV